MTKLLQKTTFVLNILILSAIDVYLWSVSLYTGIGGLIGIAGFFVGFSLSKGVVLSPRDYWRFSEYSVFKKKILYGNSIAGSTTIIASLVIYIIAEMF